MKPWLFFSLAAAVALLAYSLIYPISFRLMVDKFKGRE